MDWSENRVGERAGLEIQRHLEGCDDCRRYFEEMSKLMEGLGSDAIQRLEPDPFLPADIRARAQAKRPGGLSRARPVFGPLAASMLGVAVVGAAFAGILIGVGLSSRAIAGEETEEIVNSYYEAFSQDEFVHDWEALLEPEEGDES